MWMSHISEHHTALRGGNLLLYVPVQVHFTEQEVKDAIWLLLCKWGDVSCLMEAVCDLYATFYVYYILMCHSDSMWSVRYFPNRSAGRHSRIISFCAFRRIINTLHANSIYGALAVLIGPQLVLLGCLCWLQNHLNALWPSYWCTGWLGGGVEGPI